MPELTFPRLVYRCPGPHRKRGHTYAWRGCADEKQLEELKLAGWFATFEEAIIGNHIDRSPAPEPAPESPAPRPRRARQPRKDAE